MPRKREKQLKFFVTFSELEHIKSNVAESKSSQSDFLRKSALDKEIVVVDGITDLVLQIKKVGIKLNQITKLAHQSRVSDVSVEMEQIHGELNEIWRLLRQSLHAKRRS